MKTISANPITAREKSEPDLDPPAPLISLMKWKNPNTPIRKEKEIFFYEVVEADFFIFTLPYFPFHWLSFHAGPDDFITKY